MAIEPIAVVVLRALADAPADLSGFGMDGYEPTRMEAALSELQRSGLIDGLLVTEKGRALLKGFSK